MRRAALLLVVLGLSATAFAAPGEVVAEADGVRAVLRADPATPAIGQAVELTLDVRGPAGTAIVSGWKPYDVLTDALGDDVIEVRDVRGRDDGGSATLHVYDAGSFELPALEIGVATDAQDSAFTVLRLEGLTLDVGEVLPEEAAPLPERDALPPEEPRSSAAVWLGALAALLAVVAVVLLLLRRRASPAEPLPVPPPPPHTHALVALDALLAERLPQAGRVEPYFVRLSEIARRYVEDRFGLRAPEQTTEEFLSELGGAAGGEHAALAPHRDRLRGFLACADLVKFARDEPDIATCADAAEDVRGLVVATAPAESAESAATEPGA